MSAPLEIMLPGDASDLAPELHEIREAMIEPSTWKEQFYRTIRRNESPIDWERIYAFPSAQDFGPIEVDVWEKIKCVDHGTSFWAWRHVSTRLVLI